MSFSSSTADNVIADNGMQYHIRLKSGDIPPYVLMPGDPARVAGIANLWHSAEQVASYRHYNTYKGKIDNIELACVSSGIGSPSTSIAVEELARVGVHTIIRTGTCGALQDNIEIGDLIISSGAVRLDGASKDYVRVEYPAIADYEVVSALVAAANQLGARYHVGITATADTFYCGQGRPGFKDYFPSFQSSILSDMQKAGVKNFEMEASCLFTLSSLFNMRAGCICLVIANRAKNTFNLSEANEFLPAKVANLAMVKLNQKNYYQN